MVALYKVQLCPPVCVDTTGLYQFILKTNTWQKSRGNLQQTSCVPDMSHKKWGTCFFCPNIWFTVWESQEILTTGNTDCIWQQNVMFTNFNYIWSVFHFLLTDEEEVVCGSLQLICNCFVLVSCHLHLHLHLHENCESDSHRIGLTGKTRPFRCSHKTLRTSNLTLILCQFYQPLIQVHLCCFCDQLH